MPKNIPNRQRGLIEGYRSGLEESICAELQALGVAYEYEPFAIPYLQPQKPRKYTPDVILLSNGIVLEFKGRFVTSDRYKHLLVQQQYPDVDLRFIFANPNTRISKQSATTYAKWSEAKGFLYAKRHVPLAWLSESANARSIAAIARLRKGS